MKEKKVEGVLSADGYQRTLEEERDLNTAFSGLFKDKLGEKVLNYLKSITVNTVAGPEVSDNKLRHLEGSRYIVGLIEHRIERGKKNG